MTTSRQCITDFLDANGILWFPIALDIRPLIKDGSEVIQYGEVKMEKKLLPISHELYGNSRPKSTDFAELSEEVIRKRQRLVRDGKRRNTFNTIAIDTRKVCHIDLDIPIEELEKLSKTIPDSIFELEKLYPFYSCEYNVETDWDDGRKGIEAKGLPFYRSSTKSYGRHLFFKYEGNIKNKHPFSYLTNEVEILSGGWSYAAIDAVVENADCDIIECDFNAVTAVIENRRKPKASVSQPKNISSTKNIIPSNDTLLELSQLIKPEFLTPYDPWYKIVMSLKSYAVQHPKEEDAIRDIAANMSKGYNESISSYTDEGFDRVWNNTDIKGITIGTFYHYAKLSNEEEYTKIIQKGRVKLLNLSTDTDFGGLFNKLKGESYMYDAVGKTVYKFNGTYWCADHDNKLLYSDIRDTIAPLYKEAIDIFVEESIEKIEKVAGVEGDEEGDEEEVEEEEVEEVEEDEDEDEDEVEEVEEEEEMEEEDMEEEEVDDAKKLREKAKKLREKAKKLQEKERAKKLRERERVKNMKEKERVKKLREKERAKKLQEKGKEKAKKEKAAGKEMAKLITLRDIFNKIYDNLKTEPFIRRIVNDVIARRRVDKVEFDKDAWLFAFDNKIYDLRTGDEVKPEPSQLIATTTGYDMMESSAADDAELLNIVRQIFPDENERELYRHILSYGLIGEPVEKMFFMTGSGSNGKGLINDLMISLCGASRYGYVGSSSTLTTELKDGPNPAVAALHNKRFVVFQEANEGEALQGGVIKKITGGGAINARTLYSTITFTRIIATLILEFNKRPRFNCSVDNALIRRLCLIPMRSMFVPQEDIDNGKYDGMDNIYPINTSYKTDEWKERFRGALFKWLLPCCVAIYRAKQANPSFSIDVYINRCSVVVEKTREYIAAGDVLNDFIEEYMVYDENAAVSVKDLYKEFKQSSIFMEMDRKEKEGWSKEASFREACSKHPRLIRHYKELLRGSIVADRKYAAALGKQLARNVLINWRMKTVGEDEDGIAEVA